MPARPRRSRILARLAVLGLVLGAAGGCANLVRTPYTTTEASSADVAGYGPGIRSFLDSDKPVPANFPPATRKGEHVVYLALSGGGGNGAYGAGILNGWTRTGNRPTFNAVSGVSTGALMAPFAFLGPAYDATLKDIYTDGSAEALVRSPEPIKALFGSSIFGQRKLLDLVSKYVDADLVAAIAREHEAGRRLYVVTTNIDSKRGVVWNVGAIAASGRPDALDLVRKVLAASASVPLAFSPVFIDAQAGGHMFQEMHVDGNVTEAVFTLPLQYLGAQKRSVLSGGSLYIVMNTSVVPKFSVVDDTTFKIVGASVDTLITQKTLGELASIYSYSRANRVDYNLTAIDPSIAKFGAESFDTAYMRNLYDVGYETAVSGRFWRKSPPGSGEAAAATQ